MRVAYEFASWSKAEKLKVGSIITDPNGERIVSIGYNGMPAGWDNCCEDVVDGEMITRPEVLHAEANAIAKLARTTESGQDAMIFVTHAPCMSCAKMIYQAGIQKVYYAEEYRSTDGVDFLHDCLIHVEKIDLK